MNFSFHNQLNIKTSNGEYIFFNKILPSLLTVLSKKEKYNQFISLGTGLTNEEIQGSNHLTSHIFTSKLSNYSLQSNIDKGALFAKYQFKISVNDLPNKIITEAGLSNNDKSPIIYNYFSLISQDMPNGLDLSSENEVVFEITVNLVINEENDLILCGGNNPFLEFLLGNGINEIYFTNSSNSSDNQRMSREVQKNKSFYECSFSPNITDNSIDISISHNHSSGELNEILFISNDLVFARKNTKEIIPATTKEIQIKACSNYIIKIDEDVKSINSITKISDSSLENDYFVSKFANDFGDEISLPFNNIFTNTTSRFISNDGKILFFVLNDKTYGYINSNFKIQALNTNEITDNYIKKIIILENFIFVISEIEPYISCYIIKGNTVLKIANNFKSDEQFSKITDQTQLDISLCESNKFILGFLTENNNAISIYFSYNTETGFVTNNHLENNRTFNYVIAMSKNNFCNGQMIYLKAGETSASCRIVTHHADETETDIYSYLAYALTNNASNIYCKNRALISEKTTSPKIVIYYYPQMYEYKPSIIQSEDKNFVSNNLNYLIQKNENNFETYNLVGYDLPEKFLNSLSSFTNNSQILDVEFLFDSLLVFLDKPNQPVIGINLNLNKTQIENISESETNYLINMDSYNKLGANGESVSIKLSTRITL